MTSTRPNSWEYNFKHLDFSGLLYVIKSHVTGAGPLVLFFFIDKRGVRFHVSRAAPLRNYALCRLLPDNGGYIELVVVGGGGEGVY